MIGVIVQARTGSSRFPKKIYADINGKDTLQRVLEGVTSAELPNKIILAMPKYDEAEFQMRKDRDEFSYVDDRFDVFFGSHNDVLDRYAKAARKSNLDLVVRITADCPFTQGVVIDEMLCEYLKNGYNGFMGNNELISYVPYPDGTDIEIFPYWMLMETAQLATDPNDREHVTTYMYKRGSGYSVHAFSNIKPNTIITNKIRHFSFDTESDYKLIKRIASEYDKHFDLNKALNAI